METAAYRIHTFIGGQSMSESVLRSLGSIGTRKNVKEARRVTCLCRSATEDPLEQTSCDAMSNFDSSVASTSSLLGNFPVVGEAIERRRLRWAFKRLSPRESVSDSQRISSSIKDEVQKRLSPMDPNVSLS